MISPRIPPGSRLAVGKAMSQILFIASRYGQRLPDKDVERYRHDFEIAHSFGNLNSVEIEFISPDGKVVAAFSVAFNPVTGNVVDDAAGIEYPRLPKELVKRCRVLQVDRDKNVAKGYKHLLSINWSPADAIPRADGESYLSRHTSAISGGTCKGEFFVCDNARHSGIVRRVSPKGDWAFCKDSRELVDVFLHVNHCDNGLKFSEGLPVSYVLTKTRRGFRGERIRKA